jgi:hypothetical protein
MTGYVNIIMRDNIWNKGRVPLVFTGQGINLNFLLAINKLIHFTTLSSKTGKPNWDINP